MSSRTPRRPARLLAGLLVATLALVTGATSLGDGLAHAAAAPGWTVRNNGWTTSASTAATAAAGTTVTIQVMVTSDTTQHGIVDVEIYGGGGRPFQQYLDDQSFTAGARQTFNVDWAVPADLATGQYSVKVGIFGVGWTGLLQWNDFAATVEVTAPGSGSAATTTTSPPAATTTAATTTTSSPPSTSGPTTTRPATTAAPTTSPAVSSLPGGTVPAGAAGLTSTDCGSAGAAFCEGFSDPAAFAARFDHGWSGELHAGSLFAGDKNGWPGDHDMMCGNPNMTNRTVTLGAGNHGEDSPASSSDPAFYSCLPGGDPAKGHLMTSANTEGYAIAWFSPKQTFTNVRKVCFDNNLNYIGNGIWFQLVFVSAAEAARKPVIDGTTYNTLDLGYTSPDFPNTGGPSTPQGTASTGVKFMVNDPGTGQPDFIAHAWDNSQWQSTPVAAGSSTTDKAPRYQICVSDNENGTLTLVNASPDGTVHTNTMPGAIPAGAVRVVFEQDEYNPDKHHDNNGGVATNTGEGYTYHWDNTLIYTR